MKKILLILCLIMLISTPVFAEDISAVLEQPAVSKAVAGEKMDYKLNIALPQDTQYKSFAVTLLMDEKLSVEEVSLEGIEKSNEIILKKTEVQGKQNIISFSVNDISALNGVKDFSIKINTQVKTDAKDGDFNNSIVLTSVQADGKEVSTQKNLTSNTTVRATKTNLVINEVKTSDEIISGTTAKGAKLVVMDGVIEISTATADENGKFEIKIPKQILGTKLKVVSTYIVDGKTVNDNEEVVVADAEGKKANVAIDIKVLEDYVSMAEKIFTSNASQENKARLEAAVANAKYVLVMTDRKNSDVENAINLIKTAVKYLRQPVMEGYWDKTFKPTKQMTRAEVAQVLARVYLKQNPSGSFSSFKDVKQSAWYADAIGFMEEKGFMKGYADGTFKPEKSITRAEFAAVIANFYPGYVEDESYEYKDVKSTHWAKNAINYVSSKGLMNGRSETIFAPDEPITRAEVAKVLNKLLNRTPNKEFMDVYSVNPFTDVKNGNWAYYEILEITGN